MTVWNNVDPSIFDQSQLTVTVRGPEVVSLTASDTTIDSGDEVTISWVTRLGDTRSLIEDPDDSPFVTYANQSASGSRTFTLTVTTEFSISVWNGVDPAGTLDREFITVTVN